MKILIAIDDKEAYPNKIWKCIDIGKFGDVIGGEFVIPFLYLDDAINKFETLVSKMRSIRSGYKEYDEEHEIIEEVK